MNSDLHLSKKSSRRRFNEGPTCRQSFKLGPNALDEASYTTHTFVVSLSSLTTPLCGRKCTFPGSRTKCQKMSKLTLKLCHSSKLLENDLSSSLGSFTFAPSLLFTLLLPWMKLGEVQTCTLFLASSELKSILVVELQKVSTKCISFNFWERTGASFKMWHVCGRGKKAFTKNPCLQNLHRDITVRTQCDKNGT